VGQATNPQNILVENCDGRVRAVTYVCSWEDNVKASITFDEGCRAMKRKLDSMCGCELDHNGVFMERAVI
jgi:hypothetical protein